MIPKTGCISIILTIAWVVVFSDISNSFAADGYGGTEREVITAAYGRDEAAAESLRGISVMRAGKLSPLPGQDLTVSVLCIDGYKFAQVTTEKGDGIATDLTQMFQQAEGESLPIKCRPSAGSGNI